MSPLTALARRLRALPDVASVQVEHRYVPRVVPNDPALRAPNPNSVTVQWTLAKEGFYDAWNITRGDGALVGVIDTGIDGAHPDLRTKIQAAVDQRGDSDLRGNALTDEIGHGTHVASLACAATGNAIGMAGAGYNCKLLIEKSDFSDSSIAASIVDAANRHVDALNMSFGPAAGDPPTLARPSEVRALDYAAARKVVLVAAAADNLTTEQGDPANVVQPAGTGPSLTAGIGLDVTAAEYGGRTRAATGRASPGSATRSRSPHMARSSLTRRASWGSAAPSRAYSAPSRPTPPIWRGCRHRAAAARRSEGATATPTSREPRWRRRRWPPRRR